MYKQCILAYLISGFIYASISYITDIDEWEEAFESKVGTWCFICFLFPLFILMNIIKVYISKLKHTRIKYKISRGTKREEVKSKFPKFL